MTLQRIHDHVAVIGFEIHVRARAWIGNCSLRQATDFHLRVPQGV